MKRFKVTVWLSVLFLFAGTLHASEKATPQDVYNLVIKAYTVVEALKDEALPELNNPKGEFVYKDTYVFVLQCPEYVVAHPFAIDKLRGKDLSKVYAFQNTLCEGGESPDGNWIEYNWPKPGTKEPARKISFVIRVKGTPYTVAAGIFNEDITLEELKKTMK